MTNKAQTTKYANTDENSATKVSKQQPPQSASKIAQDKNNSSYNFFTEQNDENATKERVEGQSRNNRPLSSYENNPRAAPASLPQGPNKARNASERDNSASKVASRKEKGMNATPKAGQIVTTSYGDLRTSTQGYSIEAGKRKERPLSAKKVNKEEQQSERASSKEPQKSSLQSFVTKVNKGDVFGSIKKYGEKRDSSARRTQKPQLNLDERSTKPIRAVELDLKAPKTTPNIESKVFNVSLGKNSASPTAASTQTMIVKNTKKGAKETPKAVQDAIINAKAQGKDSFIYYMTYLEKAHRWGGEPDYFVQLYQEHFLQTFQALNFCKAIKPTDPAVLAQKRVYFPKRDTHKDKKTLVFDMDETLIHCNESLDMPADVILPILFPNGEVVEAGVNVRPYAIECLRELSQHFEIIVFTASHSCYANVVLDYLDPHEEFIHHRMFRESCVVSDEGLHIKDLRVIGNRNLKDMVLIDNAAYSYGFQLENGIPIVPFYDNKADQELRHLIPYLKFLGTVEDLREVNRQTFKFHHYGVYDEAEELLEKVILQN
jgi:Dullard-like phosphatase family protein